MASGETASTSSVKLFSREEVSKNSNRDELGDSAPVWFIIHNSVYDVTKFLNEHPGGEEILIEHAGQDATEAFEDIAHSDDARKIMAPFKIGEVLESERTKTSDKKEKNISSNNDDNRKKSKSKAKSWLSFFRK